MSRYELSEGTERRVEDAGFALAVAGLLAWVLVVHVLPGGVLASVPTAPLVVGTMVACAPAGYLLVRTVRNADGVTVEDVARVVTVVALLFGAAVLLYVALVFAGVVPLP